MTELGQLACFYGQVESVAAFAVKQGIGENSDIKRLLRKNMTELGQLACFYGQVESVVFLVQQHRIAEYTDVKKVLAMKPAGMSALLVTLQKQSLTDADLTLKAIHVTLAAASVQSRGQELSEHGKLQPGAQAMNQKVKKRATQSSAAASALGASEEDRLKLIAAQYEKDHPGCTRQAEYAPRVDVPCRKCRAKQSGMPVRGMIHNKACRERQAERNASSRHETQ